MENCVSVFLDGIGDKTARLRMSEEFLSEIKPAFGCLMCVT